MTSLRIRSFGLIAMAAAALAGPLSGVAHAAAPVPLPLLAPSGTQPQGTPLTLTPGTWDPTETGITDTWEQCDSSGGNCVPITPAVTGNSYTIPVDPSNLGTEIVVSETGTNPDSTTTTVESNLVTVLPAPANAGGTDAPVISGTPLQGNTLTASTGTWSNNPATFAYEWDDCSGSPTLTCVPSTTSTNSASYLVTATDANAQIEVKVTATNADGSTTATSDPTAAATGIPVGSGQPTITGTTWQGQTLTDSTHATWTNAPTSYAYQWIRCNPTCTNISGPTGQSYGLTSADVGSTIEVSETAANAAGPSTTALTSAATAKITVPNTAAPTISGTTERGMTLTEGAGKWTLTPTIAIQWWRCDSNGANCVEIAGPAGTATTYPLTQDDVGATMQVCETATQGSADPVTVCSGLSSPVTVLGVVPVPTVVSGSSPAVSGSAQLGRTLTGSGAQFDGNPGNFNYQWLRCNALGCSPIPGETDPTYTPTSADVGDSIAFAETATNSGGTSSTVQSSRTDTITAPSTTALQTNTSAPIAGQTVTLIATVTSAASSVKPAGTVDFHSGGAAIPGCAGLALGNQAPTAVCQTSFPASVANVTAAYSAGPGTFITGSTSSPTTLIVGRAATTLTVAASAHVSLGAKTTYTATVHPPAGSSLTPTGRVTFTDAGKSIKGCGSKALAAHKAPCSVKYLGLKRHRIAARYSGDANFAPSASITSHVLVQPQAPSGFVAVFMSWSFKFKLHATRIASLSASGLSAGIHIKVTCRGSGCPFAHRAMTVSAPGKCGKAAKTGCVAGSSFNLTPIFHRAHLRVGTQLTVAITHRGWVGKYYRFTVRRGHKPAIAVSCLAVNGTRPGVGCSAR